MRVCIAAGIEAGREFNGRGDEKNAQEVTITFASGTPAVLDAVGGAGQVQGSSGIDVGCLVDGVGVGDAVVVGYV